MGFVEGGVLVDGLGELGLEVGEEGGKGWVDGAGGGVAVKILLEVCGGTVWGGEILR